MKTIVLTACIVVVSAIGIAHYNAFRIGFDCTLHPNAMYSLCHSRYADAERTYFHGAYQVGVYDALPVEF